MDNQNISIVKSKFTKKEFEQIDHRILKALVGWRVELDGTNDELIKIPGTWDATVYPSKYFEVYKKDGDPNNVESANVIQLYLSCGWRGYSDAVIIVLTISGYDVLLADDHIVDTVSAEIYKFTGSKAKVYHRGELVTDFVKRSWWGLRKKDIDKFWLENANEWP
jgi:hypothetical protein